ncbi:MAG: C69 family dipeptidase, partial [Proteobacteria bacterium]|nr:C69 family dipeptidase [Pseudomonadota bacterium]
MCDTFVALPAVTADGSVIFGKNSDREPNEAQVLEYRPAMSHSPGRRVRCTYIEVPQAGRTHAVLLSRPFWMWGAEMGANEKGVVIGNEAVWTRMPLNRTGGLTGMDLLRLALERGDTAQEALDVIVSHLADHGQGGLCGYEDKRVVYHNAFILADPGEAWVLETAGSLWAALRVETGYAISNGLTIGEKIDRCHPDLIDTARRAGWLKKGETFDFARVYSDWFFTRFSGSRLRRSRAVRLLDENRGGLGPARAMGILRDHGPNDYRPDAHLLIDRLCAHSANPLTRHAGQSTASMVAHLTSEAKTYWVTATSAPCTGVFKPVWFEGRVLPDIGPAPEGVFDPAAMWWRHELLHRSVLLDYPGRMAVYR